ncbi:MAG: DUF4446 family protein [Candidatus Gottesmanbacteria bacterium]
MMDTKGVQLNMDVFIGVSVFLGVWMVVLTVVVFRMIGHYNKLTVGVSSKTMQEVLSSLLNKQEASMKDIATLQEALRYVEADGKLHLQRIGVVRFNPFSDTGGSQSFTLAILDGKDNGIIMTSLYARTGNRWYIKHIKAGLCEDVELSKEEQSAIKKARPV